jgi:hypothetical protein
LRARCHPERAFEQTEVKSRSMLGRISPLQLWLGLLIATVLALPSIVAAQSQPPSPTDTVREFYKAMREKKFREAFAMSIYKPAIESLSTQEFEDLRSDFDRMAAAIPEKVDLAGEQISGDAATVFVKVKEGDSAEQAQPIFLIRVNGNWIIGDKQNEAIVRKAGKEFFFNARIDTHHNEVQYMFQRITLAEVIYSQQHDGQFGNMVELITAGLVPKDLEGTESTGYSFHINRSADGKSWYAAAEPAQYGRSGRLSFYLDAAGVKSGDTGGKPLVLKN